MKKSKSILLKICNQSFLGVQKLCVTQEIEVPTFSTHHLVHFPQNRVSSGQEFSKSSLDEPAKNSFKHTSIILSLPLFDSYQTLTAKVLAAFVQLNRNVRFKYLLKVDDDSYVQLPVLIDELKNCNFEKELYWGFFDGRAPVQSKGKWVEKDYKLCDRYIPYALGGGYVLSQVRLDFFEIVSFHLRKHEIEFQFISFSEIEFEKNDGDSKCFKYIPLAL